MSDKMARVSAGPYTLGLAEWADQIDRDADALAQLLRAADERMRAADERMAQISDDCRNLGGGLLAIHGASDEATVAALKSVAYDIAMNCLSPETAAYQIERRSNPEPAQAGLTAGGGSGSAKPSEWALNEADELLNIIGDPNMRRKWVAIAFDAALDEARTDERRKLVAMLRERADELTAGNTRSGTVAAIEISRLADLLERAP